jgi:hypothetical protein
MITWLSFLLPNFSVYPQAMLDGLSFFGQKISSLDFFVFDISAIFTIFIFLLQFELFYFVAKKTVSIINFFRGSGKIEI